MMYIIPYFVEIHCNNCFNMYFCSSNPFMLYTSIVIKYIYFLINIILTNTYCTYCTFFNVMIAMKSKLHPILFFILIINYPQMKPCWKDRDKCPCVPRLPMEGQLE